MKARKNETGFGVLEMLVVLALIAAAGTATTSMMALFGRAQALSSEKQSMLQVQHHLSETIKSDLAWRRTREAEANAETFRCLIANEECAAQSTAFRLFAADGNEVELPNAVFFTDGEAEIRDTLELTWRPLCAEGAPCINPPIEITGTWTLPENIPNQPIKPINTQKYGIRITRPSALGGPPCPPGQFVAGINFDLREVNCAAVEPPAPPPDAPQLRYELNGAVIAALSVPASGAPVMVKLVNPGRVRAYRVLSTGDPAGNISIANVAGSNCPLIFAPGDYCYLNIFSGTGTGAASVGVTYEDADGNPHRADVMVVTEAPAPPPPPPPPPTYSVTLQAINANQSQGLSGASSMGQSTGQVCHYCTVSNIPAGSAFTVSATSGIRAWASCPGPMTAYTCTVTVTGNMTLSAEFH